ncbi:MAG: phosphoribosylglycinamide formyltransferase [Myxococcales bacterium]|nr:phosphoribosylglycinamide formyltransferase [Myxococcales bacterium]
MSKQARPFTPWRSWQSSWRAFFAPFVSPTTSSLTPSRPASSSFSSVSSFVSPDFTFEADLRFWQALPMDQALAPADVQGARLLALGSGSGSNFEALVQALQPCGAVFSGLFCDKPGAMILQRAERLGVRQVEPPPPEQREKRTLNDAVLHFLQEHPFDLALLAGYMRVLPARVVQPFSGKIVNVHPSILPDYPGLASIQRAYEAGDAWIGVTLHLVDGGVDEGPILSQGRILRAEGESLASLEQRIHQLEHLLYPWTVLAFLAYLQQSQRNKEGRNF